MADDRQRERDTADGPDNASPVPEGAAGEASAWSGLWQVPAIVFSAGLIVLGLYVALHRAPENDFDGALDQIDHLIAVGEFDGAANQINEVLEPNLDLANQLQRARFHVTVADWVALSQAAQGPTLEGNNRRIAEEYAQAVTLGAILDPERLERWADALIDLGELDAARNRLAELEGLASGSDAGLDVRRRRNRVLRRLVEFSLRQPDVSWESLTEILDSYRGDRLLVPGDELWAIARQAELRLEAGQPQQAVDHLLLDMRRFEPEEGLDEAEQEGLGELYALLARGYYDLGNNRYAHYHAQQAMKHFVPTDHHRGDALVLLGQLAVADGQWLEAFERFDEVVRDYATTKSYLPGLLGRAEVHSVLGDQHHARADYEKLRDLLPEAGPRRDIQPVRVARSLVGRHDAALTMGMLDVALQYIILAEAFFEPGQVPAEVFFRIASTSRQLADDLMIDVAAGPGRSGPRADEIDPAVLYESNEHYRRAADYYVQHARALAGEPGDDEDWAESLWLAADSYDLAGRHDLAILHFTEYIAGRSDADPRRAEAIFRLAQAFHAEMDHESAAKNYEQVIAGHPKSPFASRSHVPLARAYLALGRQPEARQQLSEVLTGQRYLKPDAVDYRDALIQLGTLYHDDAEYVAAIEQLDKAVRRYPNDPRIEEIRFLLADSYRRHATVIAERLDEPATPPARRQQLETLRAEQLRAAMELFAAVCDAPQKALSSDEVRDQSQQVLRFACLYRADCAFELGRYEQAVELYDDVARRFPKHHASITALIQIVNCYSNLGDYQRARIAHGRALVRLKQLPDDAFSAPDALLDRGAWERWLENMPLGEIQTSAANS